MTTTFSLDTVVTEAWGEIQSIETAALSGLADFVAGLLGTITTDQFAIINKVATEVEAQMSAGASFDTAMAAGLNVLETEEKAELTKIETAALNFIVLTTSGAGQAPAAS